MGNVRILAPKMSPKLAEYVQTFGHKPSFEAYKYKTGAEIEEMADIALLRKKPVKSWANRPSEVTGTILDDIYNQDTDNQDPSLQHSVANESLDLSPKRFYSTPNQDYSITNSQASNLRWKRSSSKKEFDINNQASPKTGHIPIKSKRDVEAPAQPVGAQIGPLGSDRKISEKSPMELPDFMTVFIFGLFSLWLYAWYDEGGWVILITICVWIAGICTIPDNNGYHFLWAYVAPLPILFAVIELVDWFGVS